MKNKKKLKRISTFFVSLLYVIFGVFAGIQLVFLLEKPAENLPFPLYLLILSGAILSFYLAFSIVIVLHEAGHLIFGLLTGYGFSSFRIADFMWKREETPEGGSRIVFCRMSLAGTAGQCLMTPPAFENGHMPYVLYNMGGIIVNLLCIPLFVGVGFLCTGIPLLRFLFFVAAASSLLSALTNGLPLPGGLTTDGCNVRSAGKSEKALYGLWLQLEVSGKLAKGVRLRDMPESWFSPKEHWNLTENPEENAMSASVAVYSQNRLMDSHAFDKAEELTDRLLEEESGVCDLHRKMLVCDKIFLELTGYNRHTVVEKLREKEQSAFMKQMKSNPAVIRTEYAYALLYEHDTAKANKLLQSFEKCARVYPYPCEIASERELMTIAENKAKEGTAQ